MFRPWSNVIVRVDGTVVPCCSDFDGELTLGDLNTQTLLEIWNGEPARALRRAHATGTGLPLVCRRCSDWRTAGDSGALGDSVTTREIPAAVEDLRCLLASRPRHLIFDLSGSRQTPEERP